MATITQRIQAFLHSPRGRQIVDKGRREMAKPENQQRLRGLIARFQNRGHRR
ncbi:hypothetical protein [Actinoplanes sp. NPDC049802]|uniref:hypothetical protein n=1 Tax=Actinoplanes sp. NPDC049802 TaxID=3154742 RepID=UPI0033F9CD3D